MERVAQHALPALRTQRRGVGQGVRRVWKGKMTNDLHASGAFYAAQLTRFKCEHCRHKSAFLISLMDYQSVRRKKVCSKCSEKLFRRGWVYTGEPI